MIAHRDRAGFSMVYAMAIKRETRGFTIFELLAVITLIAVLLTILAPSLRFAREKARRVACMSNLHQWSILLKTSAVDHNLWYHPATKNNGWIRPFHLRFITEAEYEANLFKEYFEERNRFYFCPNIAAAAGNVPMGGYDGYTWWWMAAGYQYFGNGSGKGYNVSDSTASNLYSSNPGTDNWLGWSGEPRTPSRMSDPGNWTFMADWNTLQPGWHIQAQGFQWQQPYPSDTWWAGTVGHVKGAAGTMGGIIGGTEDPRGSAGGNQILNNGSARWVDFDDLTIVWSVSNTRQHWLF